MEAYYMLNIKEALVVECRTLSEDRSVCRGENICSDGHVGFLCGNCDMGWSRDAFPGSCENCEGMPSSFVLFLQVMLDFTINALWNQFLAVSALSKTETQKNVL